MDTRQTTLHLADETNGTKVSVTSEEMVRDDYLSRCSNLETILGSCFFRRLSKVNSVPVCHHSIANFESYYKSSCRANNCGFGEELSTAAVGFVGCETTAVRDTPAGISTASDVREYECSATKVSVNALTQAINGFSKAASTRLLSKPNDSERNSAAAKLTDGPLGHD